MGLSAKGERCVTLAIFKVTFIIRFPFYSHGPFLHLGKTKYDKEIENTHGIWLGHIEKYILRREVWAQIKLGWVEGRLGGP